MQVNFFATFRPIVGTRTVEIPLPEGATVRDLVSEVVRRYPRLGDRLLDDQGQLSKHVHVFIDGRGAPYLRHGMDTTLDANQKIDIFPAVAGGKAAGRRGGGLRFAEAANRWRYGRRGPPDF